LKIARFVIEKRTSKEFYENMYREPFNELAGSTQSQARSNYVIHTLPTDTEIARKANISETIAAIQPSADKSGGDLVGVRLVYIQYRTDREIARRIQDDLQQKEVSAPGIEQVNEIEENSIRFANAVDKGEGWQFAKLCTKHASYRFWGTNRSFRKGI
jgi:hypothetical protein